jgi:flavin reductase (DIM6/NTAB) family NADH-FMN oxidoreductase RutF
VRACPTGRGRQLLIRGRGTSGPWRAGTGLVVPVQAIYESARGEPADAAEFAAAMAELVSGVGIVTVRGRSGDPAGLLATSLCSFSASPPTLLVCVDHRRRAHGALVACSCFAVHLLEADQETIADVFATGGGRKFDRVDWSWDDELPRLSNPLVYLRCRRRAVFDHDDHSIVLGRVEDVRLRESNPLVYYRRCMTWRLNGDQCI